MHNTFLRVTPEDVGIRSSGIEAFLDALATSPRTQAHSFMLLRHGRVAAQGWWAPYAPDLPHTLFSLSKTFTAAAVGLAIHEKLFTLDDPIIEHFADTAPRKPDDLLKTLRVRDLLTMSTGHDAEPPSPGASSQKWEKAFFAQPIVHKPGTFFLYNTPATFMLSSLIQRTSGQRLVDFLTPRLFEPLGIQPPLWDETSDGVSFGGFGLQVKTQDIARLGQLLLQEGRWNDEQLLPAHWVRLMTAWQVDNSAGRTSDWAQGYGFQMWRCRHDAVRADGMYGQFCVLMPKQDAVLVMTSGAVDLQGVLDAAFTHLLPAMHDALPPNPVAAAQLQARTQALALPTLPPSQHNQIAPQLLDVPLPFSQTVFDEDTPITATLSARKAGTYTLTLRIRASYALPLDPHAPTQARLALLTPHKTHTYITTHIDKEGGVRIHAQMAETASRLEIAIAPHGKTGARLRAHLCPDDKSLDDLPWIDIPLA